MKKTINNNLRILFLTVNPTLQGPLPKHNPILIEALEKKGCQVTRSTWGRHSEKENILQKLLGRLVDVLKAMLVLVKIRPDILYVATTLDEYTLARDIPLLLAVYWSPVKKVLKMHGSKTAPLASPGHSIYKLLTRILIRLSDAILLLSNEEVENWKDFEPKGRFYRVDNPFVSNDGVKSDELLRIEGMDNSRPTLLFAGRLIKAKGVFDLLDAMPKILNEVECHLLLAGDGEEKEEICHRIKKANLEKSVSLLGYLDSKRLKDVYRSSVIFILPTFHDEGFPTAITEAMSFGLPIVTTPIRGSRDHLQDGVNALFIPPKNPVAIANAVVRLINDPKLCLEMGRANREKVQEFKPENIISKYIEIFSELLR